MAYMFSVEQLDRLQLISRVLYDTFSAARSSMRSVPQDDRYKPLDNDDFSDKYFHPENYYFYRDENKSIYVVCRGNPRLHTKLGYLGHYSIVCSGFNPLQYTKKLKSLVSIQPRIFNPELYKNVFGSWRQLEGALHCFKYLLHSMYEYKQGELF